MLNLVDAIICLLKVCFTVLNFTTNGCYYAMFIIVFEVLYKIHLSFYLSLQMKFGYRIEPLSCTQIVLKVYNNKKFNSLRRHKKRRKSSVEGILQVTSVLIAGEW